MDTPAPVHSLSPPAQRLVCALWLLLPVAVISTYLVQISANGPYRTDISMFLTGARILTGGQGANLYDVALETEVQTSIDPLAISTYGLLPFNYPPYVAMFFAPFAQLGAPQLYYLWLAAQCGVLVGLSVWIALYFREQHGFLPRPVVATMFSFAPVYYALERGQLSLLMLGLWWWAFVSYRHEKWGQLGVAVALAAFKPQMAVLLLAGLVAQKRWQALGYAAAVQVALWGASILLIGPGIVQSYLGMLQ
ncbi:MAG: DUF2029 domain-containing protein, partial [Chloroflexota bacterium]|nr:DUF2029 domain-containing protein [Chloroflexota bacterium]